MKGLDLCRSYYRELIGPIIEESVPELRNSYAAALIGWGSDVLGNDDELSRDHEWGPRCVVFLPRDLKGYRKRVYDELNNQIPTEFKDFPTRFMISPDDPTIRVPTKELSGNVHVEITTCTEYFQANIGTTTPRSNIEWLVIPEHRLLELTSGEVFYDGVGELTCLRKYYDKYYPIDVWKYRLAYGWQSLGWDMDLVGLCAQRGDILSARYCVGISLHRLMRLTFMLNRRYCPSYPKWFHREFYKLPYVAGGIGPLMEECYTEHDLALVPQKLNSICERILQHQNSIEALPRIPDMPYKLLRGIRYVDCQRIADQIQETIDGELSEIGLDGAVDQWNTNECLMLDAEKMRSLSGVYR